MNPGRIILFGYTDLACRIIDLAEETAIEVCRVVLPANRKGPEVDCVRVKAQEKGLPTCLHNQPDPRTFEGMIRDESPVLGISASYSHMLPKGILSIPRQGFVNLHGSLLPRFRGPHILNWQIIEGESEGGATLHFMDEGMDTGDIIDQTSFSIFDTDVAADLRPRLDEACAELLSRNLRALLEGKAPRRRQDHSRATVYSLRRPEDGAIDFSWPVLRIHNLIRALAYPYPGAFYEEGGMRRVIGEYRSLGWVCDLKHRRYPILSLRFNGSHLTPDASTGFASGDPRNENLSLTLSFEHEGRTLGRFSLSRQSHGSPKGLLRWDGKAVQRDLFSDAVRHLALFGREELGLDPIRIFPERELS